MLTAADGTSRYQPLFECLSTGTTALGRAGTDKPELPSETWYAPDTATNADHGAMAWCSDTEHMTMYYIIIKVYNIEADKGI